MKIEVIQACALEWLEREKRHGARFDCIVTDPPYWTLGKWRSIGTTTRLGGHRDETQRREEMWFNEIDREDLWQVLVAFDTLLKKDSHAYIFCDHEVMPIILGWVRESADLSFDFSKPLVWDKVALGMGYHWRACHEYIVMLGKGKRRLNNLSEPDVLRHKRIAGGYPTEKPYDLIERLILNSTKEGDTVLDPFCGSGVVGAVCQANNRNAVLIDISEQAVMHTKLRLSLFGGKE